MSPVSMERLLVALAIAAFGFFVGITLTARHYEPRLAAANKKIGEFENAYATLAETTGRQNAAIDALELQASQRKEQARQAAVQARGAAQAHYRRSDGILGLKTPPGADPCRAAAAEFDTELAIERGREK